MNRRAESNQDESMNGAAHEHDDALAARRPFRAVDVLSGGIDRLRGPAPRQSSRARKQISAQLEPAQVRLLGELHARLNATTTRRIEKSDLVGLGIELLAAALAEIEDAVGGFDPAPDEESGTGPTGAARTATATAPRDVEDVRAYLRTYVRGYGRTEPGGKR
jgi:hypothetical protein